MAMTGASKNTNVALDIPLDDEIEVEGVILKRRPENVIVTAMSQGDTIHAWHPGGRPYVISQNSRRIAVRSMPGMGIPKRRSGHNAPVSNAEDANHLRSLLAQPKTLVIPFALYSIARRNVKHLKSIAFNKRKNVSDYFPDGITYSGDWLADHHLEIAEAATLFIDKGGRSLNHKFPLQCKLESKRIVEIDRSKDSEMTLRSFLIYYLELLDLFSCSGTVLGDAIFFPHRSKGTADFILDVVFGRPESLISLFKESNNSTQCLWFLRKAL